MTFTSSSGALNRATTDSTTKTATTRTGRGWVKTALAGVLLSTALVGPAAIADAHAGHGSEYGSTIVQSKTGDLASGPTTTQAPGAEQLTGPTTTTRPAGPSGIKNPGGGDGGDRPIRPGTPILTGQPPQPGSGSDCFVDFDDKTILSFLPDNAIATFVVWPFWNQHCGYGNEGNISIRPLDDSHYHLGYEDEQVDFCTDIGNFGRHTEPRPANPTNDELFAWYNTPCNEIDPVAETRSSITPHQVGATTQIFTYESLGPKLPFTLNEIEIVSGTSELCYLPSGPLKAEAPGDSPWDCLELGPGYYDLSNHADDVIEVRVTALTTNNSIDNIAADIL